MQHKVVITRHRPWLRWALICVVTVVVLAGAWALYAYTRTTTVSEFEQIRAEREELAVQRQKLASQLRASQAEVTQLKEQLVFMERSQEIDRTACESVKGSLKTLQSELSQLQEQVAFYRGIVSPGESRAGVRVYEFSVGRSPVAGVHRYELVLIQSVRHDRRIKGKVEMTVHGIQGGQMTALPMSELALNSDKNLVFSFKYFQEFSGEFRLPEGFRPVRVMVSVDPDGSRNKRIDNDYDWKQILGD